MTWIIVVSVLVDILVISQCPWFSVRPMATNNRASPMRLDSAVIIPAPKDFAFW
jgi:hypothetical protein